MAEGITTAIRAAKRREPACRGIVSSEVQSLATAFHYAPASPSIMTTYLTALGDNMRSRPLFQQMYLSAVSEHKAVLDLLKHTNPHMYNGTGNGIRSSFCTHTSSTGQCSPCRVLQELGSKVYSSRAQSKSRANLSASKAIAGKDYAEARKHCPVSARRDTLTGLDMLQRNVISAHEEQTKAKRAVRANQLRVTLKEQSTKLICQWKQDKDDVPEFIKSFTEAAKSGMTSACPTLDMHVPISMQRPCLHYTAH